MVIFLHLEVDTGGVAKVQQKCTKVQKVQKECKMSVIGCTPLFYNRIMTIESRSGCILLGWLFGLVFWRLHRLRSLLVSRQVMHNSIWPILYRYNYFETDGVFILGGNRL